MKMAINKEFSQEEKDKLNAFVNETDKEKALLRKAGIIIESRKWHIFKSISLIIMGLGFLFLLSLLVYQISLGKLQSSMNQSIVVNPAEAKVLAPITNELPITNNFDVNLELKIPTDFCKTYCGGNSS